MAAEWWITDNGINMLKGVEGDPDNPPMLEAEYITDFLMTIPAARESFNRLVPTLLIEEQLRLEALAVGAVTLEPIIHDRVSDSFQHRLNTQSIRTSGPRGGGSWAPPPMKR